MLPKNSKLFLQYCDRKCMLWKRIRPQKISLCPYNCVEGNYSYRKTATNPAHQPSSTFMENVNSENSIAEEFKIFLQCRDHKCMLWNRIRPQNISLCPYHCVEANYSYRKNSNKSSAPTIKYCVEKVELRKFYCNESDVFRV